jgi:hypothetical protein
LPGSQGPNLVCLVTCKGPKPGLGWPTIRPGLAQLERLIQTFKCSLAWASSRPYFAHHLPCGHPCSSSAKMLGLLMEMKVRCHLGCAVAGRHGMADGEDQVPPDCEASGHGACADTDASGRDGRAC